MLLSEKISFVVSLWILVVLLITGRGNLEIFFILSFVGVLIIRELSDLFVTDNLKGRMNLFIGLFIIIFIIIIGKQIMSLINL